MLSADEVADLFTQRRKDYQAIHSTMRLIRDIYKGEATVPLPDMAEDEKAGVPNLLAQGVDQMAGRIASTMPTPGFAAADGRTLRRRAATAGKVVSGWWQTDAVPSKMRTRARHLIAYGIAPVVVMLDPKTKLPTWRVRNPLHTYPSPDYIPGTQTPLDTLFVYNRTAGWLRANGYAPYIRMVANSHDRITDDTQFTLLEHVTAQGLTLSLSSHATAGTAAQRCVHIEVVPNPTDMVQAVVPQRLGLDGAAGQFDTMTGMYFQQAKLMALEVMAIERGIFPDTYLISRPGEMPEFIDGPHDGRSGKISVLKGGDIKEISSQPGYMTPQTIDRIERAQRLTAGVPSEFGGESGTNIRTGRRGDAVMSAVIDFPVGDAQDILATALRDEDRVAIELSKHFVGNRERTLFVGTGNNARQVKYTPNQVFPQSDHVVSYSATGADVNQLMMGLGQRVGMGTMSKLTAATLDPFIDSPEAEHDRIIAEGLESAMLAGLQQQASAGALSPLVLAKVMQLVESDRMELAEALNKAVEDAQKAAQEAQQQAQQAQQGMAGPPEPTPEMAAAGPTAVGLSGNPEALSPVPGAAPGQRDIGQLMSLLRSGGA